MRKGDWVKVKNVSKYNVDDDNVPLKEGMLMQVKYDPTVLVGEDGKKENALVCTFYDKSGPRTAVTRVSDVEYTLSTCSLLFNDTWVYGKTDKGIDDTLDRFCKMLEVDKDKITVLYNLPGDNCPCELERMEKVYS